jgi:6-phosphogluconolactonase
MYEMLTNILSLSIIIIVILQQVTMGTIASSCFEGNVSAKPIVNTFASSKELGESLTKRVIQLSSKAIAERGEFVVALSGGSLPNTIAPGLLASKDSIDWSKWKVYFADERHVAHDHADSNLKAVREAFLNQLPSAPVVYAINSDVPVEKAAEEYESKLPSGRFDLILLGMGPDGHTASLFPGHALLNEKIKKVAFIKDSPKPPPERITLTLPYINNARNVFFVTTGASKADVVARCAIEVSKLESDPLPSARVRPTNGALEWYVDSEAAAKL